ncbi:MAG: hypothetical protein QNJ55_29695 [Xenococcus sp. MO_188.B8]|nr:hypothetical protein [Xenococcus sp. MO_188.B8]
MSILSLPRLYFTGEIFWNPDTANNSAANYNESSNQVTTPLPEGVTYDTYKRYMMTYQKGQLPSGWNYFGAHGCNFVDYENTLAQKTKIVGGTMADGSYVKDDLILGKGVQIVGNIFNDKPTPCRLVDVDPYAYWASQIFFDHLTIGDQKTGIQGPRHHRMYSYWVSPNSRNLTFTNAEAPKGGAGAASGFCGVWQTSIPFDQLTITNEEGSELLAALTEAMKQPGAQGLMIRFCSYRTLYYQNGLRNKISQQPRNDEDLSKLYLAGEIFDNPAYSLVVGSIGIWNQEEPATAPAGRYLVPGPKISPQNSSQEIQLGPILAQLNRKQKILSLDLIDTFPECDRAAHKADFGSLRVQLINGEAVTDIATLSYNDYNKKAYETQAGIVDIPLSDESLVEKIETGQLVLSLRQGLRCVRALEEQLFTAVSDDRGVYVEQDELPTCTVHVRYKGVLPPAGTRLLVAQYTNGWGIISPTNWATQSMSAQNSMVLESKFITQNQSSKNSEPQQPPSGQVEIASGEVIDTDHTKGKIFEVNPEGIATFTLSGISPGCCNLQLIPFGPNEPVPQTKKENNFPGYFNYTTIRVMPFDNDLVNKPDNELTWEFMYNNFFRVYNLIYPVMSEVIPLDDRTLMEGAWMQIKAVLGEDIQENGEIKNSMWESTMYMSVTRDLSLGKRKLLQRWCNLVSRDAQP